MKRVIIIGGGFGGLSCLWGLASYNHKELEIVLIDERKSSNFLPLLPDCIGRRINPDHLIFNLENLCQKINCQFITEKVMAIDLEKKVVFTLWQSLSYDYLIIASGSETNFYGNEEIKKAAFKLDDVSDALKIRERLEKDDFDYCLVCGGGYTGIEVATNLRLYFNKKKKDKKVVIVERAPSILGPLPEWMKNYVRNNLKILNVECLTNTAIEKNEAGRVFLSGDIVLDKAMIIWTAGVKTAEFIQKLKAEKTPQGRIKVDEYLRLNGSCFVIGDCAYFADKKNFLRMAVQFAIMQGNSVAGNIIKSIRAKELCRYQPLDLGYIIPMANNLSCGMVLGMKMQGVFPTILHYFMCIYRSYTLKNKSGLIKDLIKGGG